MRWGADSAGCISRGCTRRAGASVGSRLKLPQASFQDLLNFGVEEGIVSEQSGHK